MAIELLDEHEQSEVVRKWLKDNASTILWGVIGGLVLVGGMNYWDRYQRDRQEQAEDQYLAYTEALAGKDEKAIQAAEQAIRDKHPGAAYASFAALETADTQLVAGKADDAAAELEFVRKNAPSAELKELATLRLARLRVSQGKAQDALTLIGTLKPEAFKPIALEIKGDALVALDRGAEARTAYDEALTVLDATSGTRAFLEMKRNELSAAVPAPVAATPTPTPAKSGP